MSQGVDARTDFRGRKVLISSFRNESPFVLEFVAHHKVLGFDEIVIASNDCTDGTADILDALDRAGVIRHLPCQPPPKISPQAHAYQQIRKTCPIDSADWLMILDADEFLNIHAGAGRLSDLIAAQADADLVLVNWACFGSGGHERWRNEPSTTRFLHRMRTLAGEAHVKTLLRGPAQWQTLSNHHPFGWTGQGKVRLAFAAGVWHQDVPGKDVTFGAFRDVKPMVGTFRIAQVNHYATRTADSFALRHARGRGAAPQSGKNSRHDAAYFNRMSRGAFLDDTITRYTPEVLALMAEWRADPAINRAEAEGIRLYQAEIDRYWQARDAALNAAEGEPS